MIAAELARWERLASPETGPLLEQLAHGSPTPGQLLALRDRWPREVIELGIELVRARERARSKFPDREDLIADVSGVEQATSSRVAAHKAERFRRLGPTRIVDLCSGIGGDTMALVECAPVLAFDRSPVRSWMTRHNSGSESVAQDVTTLGLRGIAFHLDPARRIETAGGARDLRQHALDDYQPGLPFLQRWTSQNPTGAVKLGPGVDLDRVQRELPGELELVSDSRRLVQAVLWTGELATTERRATWLPSGETVCGTPADPEVGDGSLGRYLLEADPAIERARLLGELGLDARELVSGLGLLTGNALGPGVTAFEVMERLPWRWAKVEAALNHHAIGPLEVKTRGKAEDPERIRRDWRPRAGGEPGTLFVLRLGQKRVAIIARRVE